MELTAFMNGACRAGKGGLNRRILQRLLTGYRRPAEQLQADVIHWPVLMALYTELTEASADYP